jgi:hypothetical protein
MVTRVVVSRKTPADGKLEIPTAFREHLAGDDRELFVQLGPNQAPAVLETMACHCAKAAVAGHEHHFLACELLRSLVPGSEVTLRRDTGSGAIVVATA